MNDEDEIGRKHSVWAKKIDSPGAVYGVVCKKCLQYGSSGKKSLTSHSKDKAHLNLLTAACQFTQTLSGATEVIAPSSRSVINRLSTQKAITCSFIAEHALPFSLGPALIEYAKELAKDSTALEKLSMCLKSVTYTLTHGVGKTVTDDLREK